MTRGRDPYLMRAKFNSKCARCGGPIQQGDTIAYFPNTRTAHCKADECSGQSMRDFAAAAADEAFMCGNWQGY